MKNKYIFRFILIFFIQYTCVAQIDSTKIKSEENLSYIEKLNSGKYPPFKKFNDSLIFPIEFQIDLFLKEIRDLNIKKNEFYTVFTSYYSSTLDTLMVTTSSDTILNWPDNYIRLIYPENDSEYHGDVLFNKRLRHPKTLDSINVWEQYEEKLLPHKWDLRDYPFDKQKLKIIYETVVDTSWFKLNLSNDFTSEIDSKRFTFLLDGLNVKNIEITKNYTNHSEKNKFIEGEREMVTEQLIFNVIVDRDGSFLYFKLFFGGFLSFLISFLVYFINFKQFDTRITLSLGGIFGAVGNKYFVENSMPSVQVLTKADIINNLVIVFIIVNIFIVIAQYTKEIEIWKFENNKFSAFFISLLFILSNLFVVYF